MSSINPHFTFIYSQPPEYKFSHDSVFLARFAFENLQQNRSGQNKAGQNKAGQNKDSENQNSFSVLDLCAGCGIIGLDFLFHYLGHFLDPQKNAAPKNLHPQVSVDFLEVQKIYESYFWENCQQLRQAYPHFAGELNFLNSNYSELQNKVIQNQGPQDQQASKKYDLVLSNPPYFRVGQGKLSPSEFKNRCRFFIDSDFTNFILSVDQALSKNGQALILLRNLQDHGFNPLLEAQNILRDKREVQIVGDIRGTSVVCIK